ncbi:MAG: DUF2892 domain-containing protein [Saprospiraceae bacterium]|nr:DUF2892 domain-containing protein [Saprospiraceae bacterium]
MQKNVGSTDRIVRTVVAAVILLLNYLGIISGTLGIVLMIFAIVLVVTSFVRFCPIYTLFGINTCSKE